MLVFLGHYLDFPSGLLRGSLSSCPVSTDRSETIGERQCYLLLAVRPSPAEGTRSWRRVSFLVPLTCAQKTLRPPSTLWEGWVLPALHPIPAAPSQSWAGLGLKNSRAGRGSLPGRQTRCGATTRKAQRFHFNPQTPGLEGSS